MDAASQSTFVAPAMRHTPRSAPVVSSANKSGSFPESFTVYSTPGYCALITAAEFSTRSGRARVGTVTMSLNVERFARTRSAGAASLAHATPTRSAANPKRHATPRNRFRSMSMLIQRYALLGAFVLGAAPADARGQALSTAEHAVATSVDAHNTEALALLERIVNINSGTMNFAGVRQVADVLRSRFDSLGFRTRWVDGAALHRAGHLVAEHPGPGPTILLIGHLDTVFEPSSPFQRFQRLNDSTARGPGVIDMKGGDVIILYALKALKDAGTLDRMNVTVVFDGDEEDSGTPTAEARRTLVDAAEGATVALGFEDGAADPRTAVISRRSAGSWTVRTTGHPAHSSQIFKPEVGAGAVYEASRIVHEFYTRLSNEPYLTFNPGMIVGGTLVDVDTDGTVGKASGKRNVVAEHAVVTGDLRTLSPEQLAKAQSTM